MKTITLTDNELDILYDMLCWTIDDEESNTTLSRDEDYIQELRQLWQKVIDAQQAKNSEDTTVPKYCVDGGEVERLTEEELKELGGFLHAIISDYLDFTLIDVTDEVKQQAIRQANTFKRIYNKLIKPIFKVEE